jgi:hypothetical protein
MASLLNSLRTDSGASVFYEEGFRVVLESHLTYLRNLNTTIPIQITSDDAYRYEGDLYGLLFMKRIPRELHWVIMRINDMTSPMEAGVDLNFLLIPETGEIDKIRQSYQTTNKII